MDAVVAVTHPLDPLSLDEIASAVAILKDTQTLAPTFRFPITRLEEPTKADLAVYRLGDRLPRLAFILAIDISNGETFEGVVNLTAGTVSSYIRLPLDELPYGQPPIMLCEFETVEGTVKSDPRWIAAVKKRGITDEDIPLIQIDPFSSGYFGREFEKGKRIVRAVSYWREDVRDNGYAHPIEGVVAVVDLITNRVVDLVDDEKIIPVPRKKRNYGRETFPEPRPDLTPLHIVQPQGPSFTVDGWKVEWQNWSFRVGFTPREGLVLHELGIKDQGRLRPVVFRASVTEMVVPYADPTANHYWKSAFDAGEYGLGRLANCLELGCDCLGHIHYFDVPAADDLGQTFIMKNAICMHEEDYGILWKHYEFRNGIFEVRRSRRLVISFFATVGNYDYGFYWYLYQDGTIQLEAKLTGIIQTAAVATGETYPWGGMVDDNLGGPTHQHFFNARLHMDVDGGDNTVTEHEFVPRPWGEDNPYGNVFDTRSRVLKRELDSPALANGETGRYWKVSNPNIQNSVGKAPGYKIVVMPSPVMLAQPDSTVAQRGGFAKKHIWVTAFDAREKYASGDYPNVHAGGDGLPGYVKQNREIENADVVLWHSFGHTHVCKPEDFPIMPVEYAGFTLKPNGFFASNIAMDLPPEENSQSVDNRLQRSADDTGNGSCCHT
ncbi:MULTISPECIES: primary-amine oxidase [Rhizobium]|uniref:primary-amine oxidase n=1 Tax=Rhizobium TaxID=379 RepID=UPI00103B7602|nr:primary-amine oxidase [Rhizobium leguminosarum]MBY5777423.1 primary-amine oxidase [Rhizobium leguminosarum]NKL99089.1 primary-amine oxidase [Rhizobium leguminosarum bv. viciae]TBZ07056.1 primary-amine oxidase [Rhizobium leguminosarum bv. viciae]TBZ16679.1 primary-amine oxidase [Rhizobium leguminosarum bv. viciae]TCA06673.1 primary-amine oxidase [Rhizobium leguminosarum bv. viciae]